MESRSTFRVLAAACFIGCLAGLAEALDTTIPLLSEVLWSPAPTGMYLGSPSIVRTASGALVASNDFFGPAHSDKPDNGSIHRSTDNGTTWEHVSYASGQYWSTLFVRGSELYTLGVTTDNGGQGKADVVIQQSLDEGSTWTARTIILSASKGYSTGPTPALFFQGRIWRAIEYNAGGWASGYHAVLVSAPMNSDLMNASNWVQTGGLPFPADQVPSNWSVPNIESNFGWLEGNAVGGPDGKVYNILRVNSLPAANKAALVRVDSPTTPPVFERFIEFPGGMSKFTIRYDPVTKLYVTLANTVKDTSIWPQPGCVFQKPGYGVGEADGTARSPAELDAATKSCCGPSGLVVCNHNCVWCRAVTRNLLTLNTSPDLITWTVRATILEDDTGFQPWVSKIYTGFQYVDFQLDGDNGDNIIALVRAGYRGSQCSHNSNRILMHTVPSWRKLLA